MPQTSSVCMEFLRMEGRVGLFLHGSPLCVYSTAICESLYVPVQKRGTHVPFFQAIKRQQYKKEEALAPHPFVVIASAILFDQGRGEKEIPASDIPRINIYIYIHGAA